jgi:hypothetical protein
MKSNSQKFPKSAELVAAICGGLLMSFPAFAQTPVTQQPSSANSKINPCPRIFYEPQHTNRVLVPQGCPPNALTQRMQSQGMLPSSSVPATQSADQRTMGVGEQTSSEQRRMGVGEHTSSDQRRMGVGEQTSSDQRRMGVGGETSSDQRRMGVGEQTSSDQRRMGVGEQTSSDQRRMGVGGETPSRTTNSRVNPNPGILKEAPYNRSQQPSQTDSSTSYTVPTQPSVTEPSLREQGQTPVTTVALANGSVNVRLVNETGANVTYQVIGDTNERSLSGKTDVVLQGLRAPFTVTFQREDGGLLSVTPQPSSETGLLEVRLDETTDVAEDTKAMRIQSNGSVYLN